MNLKNQLKNYLEYFDITAAQLSRKTGVSQQVLSTWLRGGEPKKMSQVKKVADAFNVTVDHLCFGKCIESVVEPTPKMNLIDEQWISGIFEVKIRRVK